MDGGGKEGVTEGGREGRGEAHHPPSSSSKERKPELLD
jgi:hypothetical protein